MYIISSSSAEDGFLKHFFHRMNHTAYLLVVYVRLSSLGRHIDDDADMPLVFLQRDLGTNVTNCNPSSLTNFYKPDFHQCQWR